MQTDVNVRSAELDPRDCAFQMIKVIFTQMERFKFSKRRLECAAVAVTDRAVWV
jgi:hypothetical protein